MQADGDEPGPARPLAAHRGQQAERHGRGQQHQRDQPGRPGQVPQRGRRGDDDRRRRGRGRGTGQRSGHEGLAVAGTGVVRPAGRGLDRPVRPDQPGGQAISVSQAMAAAPRMMPAVLAVLASRARPAATLTVRQQDRAGSPVAGSMMWCSRRPSLAQARTVVLEVARPPALIVTVWPGASGPGGVVVGDPDPPAAGRRARHGDVAAQADQHRAAQLGRDHLGAPVSGPGLGRGAEVQLGPAGERDRGGSVPARPCASRAPRPGRQARSWRRAGGLAAAAPRARAWTSAKSRS